MEKYWWNWEEAQAPSCERRDFYCDMENNTMKMFRFYFSVYQRIDSEGFMLNYLLKLMCRIVKNQMAKYTYISMIGWNSLNHFGEVIFKSALSRSLKITIQGSPISHIYSLYCCSYSFQNSIYYLNSFFITFRCISMDSFWQKFFSSLIFFSNWSLS